MTKINHQVLVDGRADSELTSALAELSVSESVRGESRFRLRFVVDIQGTGIAFLADKRLLPGKDRTITIIAFVEARPEVLVHGVIQGREVNLRHGGPGSYLDVLGCDRRTVMDRNYSDYGAHAGAVPTIVTGLFAKHGFVPDVEFVQSDIYTPLTKSLNQTASDLMLINRLAAQHSVEFWIDWQLLPGGKVVETAHFRSQPPRGAGAGLASGIPVLGGGPTELRMNTADASNTIMSFRSRRRTDHPNRSGSVKRVDVDTGRIETTQVREPSQPPLGEAFDNVAIERSVLSAGPASDAQRRAEAALNDAGWSVEAYAETTVFQLGGLVRPRQIVQVAGLGSVDDGEYFVWSVQHRADEAGHQMGVELRRNATGPLGAGGIL